MWHGSEGMGKFKEGRKEMVYQYLVMKKKCLMEAKELLESKLPELLESEDLEVVATLIRDAERYHKRCFRDAGTMEGTVIQ